MKIYSYKEKYHFLAGLPFFMASPLASHSCTAGYNAALKHHNF